MLDFQMGHEYEHRLDDAMAKSVSTC